MGSDPTRIQFFIPTNSTRVLVANSTDSIRSIHERIQSSTGIPVTKQRLFYRGKHLELDRTLSECGVQNDAELQLVCRTSNTEHTEATKIVNDVVSLIRYLYEKAHPGRMTLKHMIVNLLKITPQNDPVKASAHLQILANSSVPRDLVMLYMCSHMRNSREVAAEAIRKFNSTVLPEHTYHRDCAVVVFEFCSLLSEAGRTNDPLYEICRSSLRAMMECSECRETKGLFCLQIINVRTLVVDLARDLGSYAKTDSIHGPLSRLVKDFTKFARFFRIEIELRFASSHEKLRSALASYSKEISYLHMVFLELLSKLGKRLVEIEKHVDSVKEQNDEAFCVGDRKYLCLLKSLGGISKINNEWEVVFWETLKRGKRALSCLIVMYVKRGDDYNWILEYKEAINFEARRHLAMMMIPEVKRDFEQRHEMIISRSNLLAESFAYIANEDPQSLHTPLFVMFDNEKAIGPGVLREWFFLVCQEIVNPQNSLFLACPNDRRRFFPNPDPLHLEYFSFCGRLIALALMHRVQVGIVLDRVFFLQLAGHSISLEDIRDADPFLYRSCKQILEMDPEVVDQDALGLTFIHEVEELGTRKAAELFPGGRSTVVNSKNRNQFVDSLIKHRFVTSISKQVANFAQGFTDIMSCQWCHHSFFRCLDLEDLDWMLHGSESAISVDDWKAHTEYHGFKETDPQISWFWENVGCMSIEKKRALLFFWTSIKYLPVEGFSGLASRLCISKTDESCDHLPSSRTCFSLLRLPVYSSSSVMHDRLNVVTQEHLSCICKTDESCDHLPSSRTCFSQLRLPAYPSFSVVRDRLNVITQENVGCSFGVS